MSGAQALAPPRLIDQARAGDRESLERLLAVCRPDLERYARRQCESEDVEEAIQDALWILYRRLGALRGIAALAGWLFKVVKRACQDHARRRRRRPWTSIEDLPQGVERDRLAVDAELRVVLAGVIAALPAPYRTVLILKDVQGLSADELAARLGLTVEAAKSRLHRARAMAREAMGAEATPGMGARA